MTSQESIKFINKVSKKEAEDILQILISSLIFDSSKNVKDDLTSKGIFISFFSVALENVMHNDVVKSKQDRLKVIKFIDKLKQQESAIDFVKGDRTNLQIAAERLGRKAQSSFSSSKQRSKKPLTIS